MTQSLAQLQAELRNWSPMTNTYNNPKYEAAIKLADALSPHVEREAAAQAKSLADERRIAELEAILKVARDAIEAQPIDAFGEGFIDHGPEYGPEPYPIRDELVYRISAALRVETKHEHI